MGLNPIREDFLADTPFGTYRMANLYADFPSSSSPSSGQQPTTPSSDDSDILILCSHFDTKTLTFRFLGANDGASSTAALLELARAITSHGRRPMTYRFLFLDGEEAMRRTWMDPDNTYGSRHHVQGIAERAENQRVRACVLLDMVGDKELQLTRDTFSHPDLLELFFQAARSNDLGDHVDGPPIPIKDDHLPFQRFEIPSCDLIDFEYGLYNEHWHRASDLPSNCSVESLATIGRIVLLGLPAVEQRFASR
jgi:glutaminyl-peptide cyclotransferase